MPDPVDAAGSDFGFEVFSARIGAPPARRYGQLAHVRQRIGDRPLKQPLRTASERRICSERGIEPRQPVEEAGDIGVPGLRVRLAPDVLASRQRIPQSNRSPRVTESRRRCGFPRTRGTTRNRSVRQQDLGIGMPALLRYGARNRVHRSSQWLRSSLMPPISARSQHSPADTG